MTEYDFLTGVWKSVKNTFIVLGPAFLAALVAFQTNAPVEYQPYIISIVGFLSYLVKNYVQVKGE